MRRSWWPLVLAALLVPAAPSAAAPVLPHPAPRTEVLHRVVWDQYEKKGTHLWSANPDGSDPRMIYRRPAGSAMGICLSRDGTEAALAPFTLRGSRAALVVADVLGDAASRNLIADHPEIYYVGGIGWSPNGQKLVFEGGIDEGERGLHSYLFTVHEDGTRLRRFASLGRVTASSPINVCLAWTADGVLYEDRTGLVLLADGTRRTVMRGGSDLQISGDGSWVYLEQRGLRRETFWRLRPDGSGLDRLYRMGKPGDGTPYVFDFTPSYDGSQMLSVVDPSDGMSGWAVVTHDATRAPSAQDPVLPFSGIASITWN